MSFTTNVYNGLSFVFVTADVNGDGKPDLVSAQWAGTVTVLTNNGSGVFGSNGTYNVGLAPGCVLAADVNGDGKLDLVTANTGNSQGTLQGHTLTVLTNDGSGVFGSNATLNVGLGPNWVIAADVNGDGKLDLITANGGSTGLPGKGNTLTVLTNNGSGGFGSNATYTVGTYPTCVMAVDISNKGKPDLISVNDGAGTLTVLTNDGSGNFGFNAALLGYPNTTRWATVADVNGDGRPDLIVADLLNNALVVLTNNGNGGFGSNAMYQVGAWPVCVVAADVNGDGWPDLISADSSGQTLTVLTNNQSGAFSLATTLSVGGGAYFVTVADVNGDGKFDLLSANGSGTLIVFNNTTVFLGPLLSIAYQSNQIGLFWPSSATNYVLESSDDLSVSNWAAVTNGTPTIGGLILSNNLPAAFFRLHKY